MVSWHQSGFNIVNMTKTMSTSRRILLIDDDNDHLSLCKLILERNGFEVKTLDRADRLIEIIAEFKPGLVFVDHNLIGITGIEVTKMIKSHAGSNPIPVIYFSSCEDIVNKAKDAGADDYLSKPFEFAKFIDSAKKYLKNS